MFLQWFRLGERDEFAGEKSAGQTVHRGFGILLEKQPLFFEWFVQLVEPTADRVVLDSIPCVGPVTIDVVLAEVGDIRRFGSQRKATAYAGLAPGIRESAGKAKQLGITKQGSRLLRTILVETAWRLVP